MARLSAATAATRSPTNRTLESSRYVSYGEGSGHACPAVVCGTRGTSLYLSTACTPASALAFRVSMRLIRACAYGLGRILPWSMPCISISSVNAGAPAFTDDIEMQGMLHGKILPSPYAHARIKRIDTRKAKALAGVHAVLTYKDVPRVPHTRSEEH